VSAAICRALSDRPLEEEPLGRHRAQERAYNSDFDPIAPPLLWAHRFPLLWSRPSAYRHSHHLNGGNTSGFLKVASVEDARPLPVMHHRLQFEIAHVVNPAHERSSLT
jgi:hypothetical protein